MKRRASPSVNSHVPITVLPSLSCTRKKLLSKSRPAPGSLTETLTAPGAEFKKALSSGETAVISGAVLSRRISTHTAGPELPASSSSQISRAFSPSDNRYWLVQSVLLPGGTFFVPFITTPVPASRVPSRVIKGVFDWFCSGRTCMVPLYTVPPVIMGASGSWLSMTNVKVCC